MKPIYVLWLAGEGSLCLLKGYIPSSHSTPGRRLLSPTEDCTSELVTETGAGLPLPQVCEMYSWPQSRGSPAVIDLVFHHPGPCFFFLSRYSPMLPQTLSLPFVSPQKGIPPLSAYAAHFLFPSSQSCTYGLPGCPHGSLEMSLLLCSLDS